EDGIRDRTVTGVPDVCSSDLFAGEIVNCDSVALYREFEIGTAKPNPEERSRAPHHMFDVVSPTQPCSAGDYARQARDVLQEIKRSEERRVGKEGRSGRAPYQY